MSHHAAGSAATTEGAIEIDGQFFADPFDIPASLSPRIRPEHHPQIFGIIRARYGRMIKRALREPGTRALLLCDRKVVGTAECAGEFRLDQIHRIERQHDRVCFIYGTGDLVEDCGWSPLRRDDAYPTLRVWLAPDGATEAPVQQVGVELLADFDTGNPRLPLGFNAFDASLGAAAGMPPNVNGEDVHLGARYEFWLCHALVGTTDEQGRTRARATEVRLVTNWVASPFRRVNPRRRGFVGREIMFALGLRITLDPAARRTRVEFA